jgi:hypothetical protein
MAKFTRLANLDPAGGLRSLGQIRSNGGPPSKKTVSAGSNGSFEAAVRRFIILSHSTP